MSNYIKHLAILISVLVSAYFIVCAGFLFFYYNDLRGGVFYGVFAIISTLCYVGILYYEDLYKMIQNKRGKTNKEEQKTSNQ